MMLVMCQLHVMCKHARFSEFGMCTSVAVQHVKTQVTVHHVSVKTQATVSFCVPTSFTDVTMMPHARKT